jgi:hypothetical protein
MMKKNITIIFVITLLTLTQIGSSQVNVNLGGMVFNGSQDSTAVADIDIELQKLKSSGGIPDIIETAQSNSRGRFSFSLTNADTSATYVFGANNQSVHYFSNTFKLSSPTKPILVIYDTTKSTTGVTAFMHHFFLEDDGRSISVRETIVLTNPTNKTIVGAVHEHGIGDATLKFQLPVGAQNFSPMEQNSGVELEKSGDFVFDKGVFIPGKRQISYVYQLPWRRNAVNAFLKVTHGASSFDIFLNNPNLRIHSQQLVDHGPFNIRGVPYRRLGTMNVAPGTQIELVIERDGSIEQNPMPIILITSLLLGLVLAYGLSLKSTAPKTKTTNNRKDLERDKSVLIEKVAKLDSKIINNSSASLKEERTQLFEQLQKVAFELSKSKESSRKKK